MSKTTRCWPQALRESGNVFLPVFLSGDEKGSSEGHEAFLRKSAPDTAGSTAAPTVYHSATVPIPVLAAAARGGANVHVEPDADGVFRRLPLRASFGDRTVPSVALALAGLNGEAARRPRRLSTGMERCSSATGARLKTHPRSPPLPRRPIIDSWLKMSEGKPPDVAPETFAGKNVLIGLSAVGLLDIKTSPVSRAVPGVEIQAAALDTLLRGRFLRPPSPLLDALLTAFLALLAAVGVSYLKKSSAMIAASVGLLLVPAVLSCLGFAAGRWTALVLPTGGVLFAVIAAAVLNYAVEGRQRRFLKTAFRHYLSPHVVDRVVRDPGLLRLGGDRREITSFFSDVAGFTSISESLGAEGLVALLNEYLTAMTDIILDEGGTLDKYEGDAIVAFWNAPLDEADHARRACRAALDCQARLDALGPSFEARYGHRLRMRIGLNTGPAVVGNMGSARRFDYTAMGDTVNLAARLEGACKAYGISTLAGEAVVAAAGETILAREVDVLRVVGKNKPVRIFEVVGQRETATPEVLARLEAFERVLEAYRRRSWEEAETKAVALAGDPVAAVYAARCARFRSEPPAADWDFVYELKTK